MNPILKNFLLVGKAIGEQMLPGIAGVETAIKAVKAGGDKKAAVVEIVKSSMEVTESLLDKDLVNDPMFSEAIDEINDGYVKLLNAIKSRAQTDTTK
jgi:hypothetical protein